MLQSNRCNLHLKKKEMGLAGCNLFVWFVCLRQKFQLHEKISCMVPFHKKAKVSNNPAHLRVIVLTSHTRKCWGVVLDHLTRQVCVFQGRQRNSPFTSQQFAVTLRPLPAPSAFSTVQPLFFFADKLIHFKPHHSCIMELPGF